MRLLPAQLRRRQHQIANGRVVRRSVKVRATASQDDGKWRTAKVLLAKSSVRLDLRVRGQMPSEMAVREDGAPPRKLTTREMLRINPRATVVQCRSAEVDYDVVMLPEDERLIRDILAGSLQ
jgi:hypothetical protein